MELYESAIKQKQDEIKNTSIESNYSIATVTSLFEDKCPKLTFIGEEVESSKKYSYIYTYIPSIGDNVLLIRANDTYVIIGKIAYNIAPDEVGYTNAQIDANIDDVTKDKIAVSENSTLTEVSKRITANNTTVYYNVDTKIETALKPYLKLTNGTIQLTADTDSSYIRNLRSNEFQHVGSKIGFFNKSMTSKTSCSTVSVSADLATLIKAHNALVTALIGYGLV